MSAIAVDAMGGDNAPGPEVAGAVAAVREAALEVILVGDEDRLRRELERLGAAAEPRIRIVHASEVVTMKDHPGQAYRKKRDSSLRVAFELHKAGEAVGVVSAGNSGAVLSHGLFVLKRLPGVERPGIATVFPTPDGTLVLCDMGANVDVKPTMLAQFGVLGAHFDRILHGHSRPRVGLLSNGAEESKGTELTRAAHRLLVAAGEHPSAGFDYVGYVEGSDLFRGGIDVVATDGFTGNVVLKTSEGVSEAVMRMVKHALLSSTRGKLGALMAKPALLELRRSIHYSQAGGAPLVGVAGIAIICHGRSDATAIENAIKATDRFARARLDTELGEAISRHQDLWQPAEDAAETRA
jgi:glycerol-3-phosphate acyltransferase PlsX